MDTRHTRCLNCGGTFWQHSPDPGTHPCDEWHPSSLVQWPVRVVIRKDFDGKWAASWPSDIVRVGLSAGAGRHETQAALVAAIEGKGLPGGVCYGAVAVGRSCRAGRAGVVDD